MRLFITSVFTLAILSSFVFFLVILILLYGGKIDLTFAITLTIGVNLILWLIGPKITELMTKWFYHCKYLSKEEVEQLYPAVAEIINQVTTTYHFPFPKVGVIPDKNPTAFSYGSGRFNARLVLTDGIFHFLSPQEVKSVVAHELGHIKNRDFIVMMIASTLVQIVYEIYAVLIRAKGRKSGNLKIIALIAYALYIVGTYILLFLSRTREYMADEFSSQVTSAEDLATSLIKIAYGIVTTIDDEKEKHLLHSTRQLGIIDVEHAKQIGVVSYITNHDPNVLAEVMVFDKVSPWAKLVELNSTHPLTGKRIERLSRLSKNQGKPFAFDIDAAIDRLKVNSKKLYENFFLGLIIYFLPFILPLIFILFGSVLWIIFGFALGLLIQVIYKFPFSRAVESSVLDEMRNPYASPIRGKPVLFSGNVIGRGVPGYVFNADMMYQDKTGLIFMMYNSFFGSIGNLFFALGKIKTLFGVQSEAEGWFFRGMGSVMALKYIKTDKETVRSHPILWSFFYPIAIMAVIILISLYVSHSFNLHTPFASKQENTITQNIQPNYVSTPTPTIAYVSNTPEALSLDAPVMYPQIAWQQLPADVRNRYLHYSGIYNSSPYGGDYPVSGKVWQGRIIAADANYSVVQNYYNNLLGQEGWVNTATIDGLTLDIRKEQMHGPCDHGTTGFVAYKGGMVRLLTISSSNDPCTGEFDTPPITEYIGYTIFLSDPTSLSSIKQAAVNSR